MFNDVRKAIITGSTGGPGQALVRKLISEGVEVLLLVRGNSGRAKYLPENELLKTCDFDLLQIDNINLDSSDYDIFFHLGWDYTDPQRRIDPYYQSMNISTTLSAVKLAQRTGCKCFVGCGSQAEYGRVSGCLSSQTPCRPDIAYGMAKLCAGQMAKLACKDYKMKFNWVRVLSAYGPVDNPYNVFSTTILGILKGERLEYTRGEQIWDILYTSDLADAFWRVALYGIDGKTYTIGSGEEMTLREEIEIFAQLVDPNYKLHFGAKPYADEQVMYLRADNTEIENDVGWRPTTDIYMGAEKTIAFWKKLYSMYGNNIYDEYFKNGTRVKWE